MVAKVIVVVTKMGKKQRGEKRFSNGMPPPPSSYMLMSFHLLGVDAGQMRDRCRVCVCCAVWDCRGTSLHKWQCKLACGLVWDGCRSAWNHVPGLPGGKRAPTGTSVQRYVLLGTSSLPGIWRSQGGQLYLKSRHSLTFSLKKLARLWFGGKKIASGEECRAGGVTRSVLENCGREGEEVFSRRA